MQLFNLKFKVMRNYQKLFLLAMIVLTIGWFFTAISVTSLS